MNVGKQFDDIFSFFEFNSTTKCVAFTQINASLEAKKFPLSFELLSERFIARKPSKSILES